MTDGALTPREAGEILARLDTIGDRLDKIDARLDAGDRRFLAMDKQDAADGALRTMATRVGTWVIGIVSAVGLAVLSHVPWIAEWLIPPKH